MTERRHPDGTDCVGNPGNCLKAVFPTNHTKNFGNYPFYTPKKITF
jgi:hypothetical protein